MTYQVVFYRTESGSEPVREWLTGLGRDDRRAIAADIKTLQWGLPLGMNLARKVDRRMWELRCQLDARVARILFVRKGDQIVLMHGVARLEEYHRRAPKPQRGRDSEEPGHQAAGS